MKAQGKRASYFRKYDYKTGKYTKVDLILNILVKELLF
jgi:hypothetical protein